MNQKMAMAAMTRAMRMTPMAVAIFLRTPVRVGPCTGEEARRGEEAGVRDMGSLSGHSGWDEAGARARASWVCRPSDQLLILALVTTLECV